MKKINPIKQTLEYGFWEEWYKYNDPNGIIQHQWEFHHSRFPEFDGLVHTTGLDLGCGPVSVFEKFEHIDTNEIWALDPLLTRFSSFAENYKTSRINYLEGDGEQLPFENKTFHWVACLNVIDHTPNPIEMLSEIKRVLKPDGILFFEVFFEDELTSPHYELWRGPNLHIVRQLFNEQRYNIERDDILKRNVFTGVYII